MTNILNIHESYNARTLTTEQVCKKFITHPHYFRLSTAANSLLVGPRGSGKTTLMKMLQVEALEIWEDESADAFRESIDYSGVFIPTDSIWKKQFEIITKGIKDKDFAEKRVTEIFIYHTIEQIAKTLEFRTNRNTSKKNKFKAINLEKKDEKELVLELSKIWKVDPIITTFRSLCASILLKKQILTENIYNIAKKEISEQNFNTDSFVDLMEVVSSGISTINHYINETGSKWVLLFDELELAPEQIIQPLINSMRGGPDEIIIKLSLWPYHKNLSIGGDPLGPSRNNDFNYIDLAISEFDELSKLDNEKAGEEFARELCQQLHKAQGNDGKIEDSFETHECVPVPSKDFKPLSIKDVSFNEYLEKNKISVEYLSKYTEKDKRPTIRKIESIVFLRSHYLSSDLSVRSLKRPIDYYAGFFNIAKSLEYNPRMLIATMNILLPKLKDRSKKIKIFQQLNAIKKSRETLTSLLNTIPVDYSGCKTVFDFINKVGEYFEKGIKGKSFNGEPNASFNTYKDVDPELKKTIGLALNSGAIIKIHQSGEETNLNTILSSRFRLSYLFAHKYILPLQLMKAIGINEIFKKVTDKKKKLNKKDPSISMEKMQDYIQKK